MLARLFQRKSAPVRDARESLRPLWGDEERYAVAQRESNPRMEDLLRADLARGGADENLSEGWDTTTLYDEIRERAADGESPDVPADDDLP